MHVLRVAVAAVLLAAVSAVDCQGILDLIPKGPGRPPTLSSLVLPTWIGSTAPAAPRTPVSEPASAPAEEEIIEGAEKDEEEKEDQPPVPAPASVPAPATGVDVAHSNDSDYFPCRTPQRLPETMMFPLLVS